MATGTILFDTFMRPLELAGLSRLRKRVVGRAAGSVLEIGAGSGLNAPHYRFDRISDLTVTDKSADRPVLSRALRKVAAPLERIVIQDADATALPFPDNAFDTVVCTLVLCSVPSVERAASEMRRVLKPGGTVHFIEHIHTPRVTLKPVFETLTPAWRRVADGCHLNRDTPALLIRGGFHVMVGTRSFDGVVVSGVAR
ncbi:MAG: class I SAM-dependent methyltransferase [Spirochaetota bacterium]